MPRPARTGRIVFPDQRLTGYVRQRDVIRAYDRALTQARAEEYGEG